MKSIRTLAVALAGAGLVAAFSTALGAQPCPVRLDPYVSGLSLPVAFVQDPQHANVQYVVQQRGLIRRIIDGALSGTDFMSLVGTVSSSGNERGLLGLAFPNDPDDDRFYVYYTRLSDGAVMIVRYDRMNGDDLRGDAASAEPLITIPHPISNHNGGNLMFGPDGYLYAGVGDGGSAGDPPHNAQNPNTLLGKMLRIDVSPQNGYAIPPDNPFVDDVPVNALEEIWAFGMRNPWRWSFDDPDLGGTGALVIADVGQNAWEEIDYEPAGAGGRNYGWRNREGAHPYDGSLAPAYNPLTDPIYEYNHGVGLAITGGFVYRGYDLGSAWQGRYIFADFQFGRVFSIRITTNGQGEGIASDFREHTAELGGSGFVGNISSFGVDSEGEVYLCSFNGTVRKLAPQTTPYIMPESFTRIRGLPVAGVLSDLFLGDNLRLESRPDVFRTTSTPPVQIRIDGVCPDFTPSELRFTLESRVNSGNISQRILLWNYDTDQYDSMDTRITTQADGTVQIVLSSTVAPIYVRNSDGHVRALVQYIGLAFSIPPTWVLGLDRALWEYCP